jgi:hypothetical protein
VDAFVELFATKSVAICVMSLIAIVPNADDFTAISGPTPAMNDDLPQFEKGWAAMTGSKEE